MWTMSDRLQESLVANSQTVVNKLEVLRDGQVVLTIDGRTVVDAAGNDTALIDGSVQVGRDTVRRSGSVVVADVSDVLTPKEATDLFVALRCEVRPYRGLLFADRTTETPPNDRELVPLATLVASRAKVTWPTVTITGFDRMWLLNRYRFESEFTVVGGQLNTDLLAQLVLSRMPAGRGEHNFPTLPYTLPTLVWDAQDQPGERMHDVAESIGHMLYADPMGVFQLTPEPTTDDDPVWTYAAGADATLLPWPDDEESGEDSANVVVATGEPQDGSAPVSGTASNDNPASALYTQAVGRIPLFISSPLFTTAAQAALGAQTVLTKQGLADVVTFQAVVNPGHESGDVVLVSAAHPGGINRKIILDTFTVPLRGIGPQQFVSRAQVVIA